MKRITFALLLFLLFSAFNGNAEEMIKLTFPNGEKTFFGLTEKVTVTTLADGDIKVASANQSLISPAGTKLVFTKGELDEPVVKRGDVNGDGNVNISDVTELIDALLTGAEMIPEADCDLDGAMNIADVTTLIDFLLSGQWPAGE